MKKNNLCKEAVVLLITALLIFSTAAVTADTNGSDINELTTQCCPSVSETSGSSVEHTDQNIIWDNGGTIPGSNCYSTQRDTCYPFISQVADDFMFEAETTVTDFHWYGCFWGGDPFDPLDFEVFIYADDGTGNAPTGGGMGDPSSTALWSGFYPAVTGLPLDPNGFYSYEVVLDPPFVAQAGEKYWIAVVSVFCFPPQWGWANTGGIQLAPAVQGFPLLAVPFWTLIDPQVDMAFYLTGPTGEECSIDVEKYVWDPITQEWVDADTEGEALDLPVCTTAEFLIVIHNDGDCPIYDIIVYDTMHDSLEFEYAEPPPDEFYYDPPYYYMYWYFPGPLYPCETIEIYIYAHVMGPPCQTDFNYVEVFGYCDCPPFEVYDDDWAWVHAVEPCEPSIDVEKYIWDPELEEWVDADSEGEAVDLEVGSTAEFWIAIHNDGTCCELYDIWALDAMEDSLEYISADPPPDYVEYIEPYWYIEWYGMGPLQPCEWIHLYITAEVVGEPCEIDYNYVYADALCDCDPYYVWDDDYAYVHAVAPPEPAICCEGEIEWLDVEPGTQVTATFEICNCGEPGSLLNWEICDEPEWGTDWEFDPASGTGLQEGDCVEVEVTVTAPDEGDETFEGEIEACNSDNPDDSCTVDVKLVTPFDLVRQRNLFLEQILYFLI